VVRTSDSVKVPIWSVPQAHCLRAAIQPSDRIARAEALQRNIDDQRPVIARPAPLLVAAHAHRSELWRPALRNEAVVDVEGLVLAPAEIEGGVVFGSVRVASPGVIAADEAELVEAGDQGTVVSRRVVLVV